VINNVVLVGRLGSDPELTYTQSGTALCKFRLAVSRPPRGDSNEEETDWLDIVTWGRTAENSNQYLDKGARVGVEGRIQTRTWQRDDGSKGYGVEINAFRVTFLESRQERELRQGGGGGRPPQQRGGGGQQQRPQQQGPPPQQQQQGDQGGGQNGPDIDWTMDEEEDPFGDQ
jgi:single-strand DNA-binding protein